MTDKKFSKWCKWPERDEKLPDLKYPGVYMVAFSENEDFPECVGWEETILYIGMTNARRGLKGRLDAFDSTMKGNGPLHCGADRVLCKYRNYDHFKNHAYVAVAPFPCNIPYKNPEDLEAMGDVTKFEYQCFAKHVRSHNKLPDFNDRNKKRYSTTCHPDRSPA